MWTQIDHENAKRLLVLLAHGPASRVQLRKVVDDDLHLLLALGLLREVALIESAPPFGAPERPGKARVYKVVRGALQELLAEGGVPAEEVRHG